MKSGITNCTELIFKNFKQKKSVFLLEAMILTVVSVIIFSVLLLSLSSRKEKRDELNASSNYHVTYLGKEATLKKIKEGSYGVKKVAFYKNVFTTIQNGNDLISSEVRFYEKAEDISCDYLINGEMPSSGQVLLPESCLYSKVGIWKIGDEVSVTFENGKVQNYIVSGFYSFNTTGVKMTEGPAIIFDAFDGSEEEMNAEVMFNSEWDIVKKSKRLAEAYGLNYYMVNSERTSFFYQGSKGRIDLLIGIVVAIIIIISSYTMIRSFIAMRSGKINRENAILRSFGIKRRTIYKLSALESIYMAVPTVVLGAVISVSFYLASASISGLPIAKSLIFVKGGFIPSVIITMVSVILLTIIVMFANARNGLKKGISEILLTEQKVIIGTKKRNGKKHKNPVKAYIITSITRNGWKTLLSILPFTIGIMYIIMLSASKNDIGTVYGNARRAVPVYDAKITLKDEYEQENTIDELVTFISSIEGIDKVKINHQLINYQPNIDENFKMADFDNSYSKKDGVYSVLALKVYDQDEIKAIKDVLTEGTTEIKDSGCILVNYAYPLLENGTPDYEKKEKVSELEIGDSITIIDIAEVNKKAIDLKRKGEFGFDSSTECIKSVSRKPEDGIKLEIKGIANYSLSNDDNYAPTIIISDEYYRKLLGDDNYFNYCDAIYIKLKDDVKLYEINEKLIEKKGIISAEYLNFDRMAMEEMSSMMSSTLTLFSVAILVGIITLFSTIMMNWELSQKEYAILKSAGATNRRVIEMILTEKSIICMSSFAIGALLGLSLEKLMMKILSDGVKVPFSIPLMELLITFVSMLTLTLLLTLFQSRVLTKMNLAEVLKESR